MIDVLSKILQTKRKEVDQARRNRSLEDIRNAVHDMVPTRGFAQALRVPGISIIAEIKKASPSRGVLKVNFDHRTLGAEFEAGGAAALSILTDKEFFQGSPAFLAEVRTVTHIPLLRKDFIIDPYQVYESRALGADAILLIARILDKHQLEDLSALAHEQGLDALVEVHTREEIETANNASCEIIGINNRDLVDFSVSLERSVSLRPLLRREALAVSESGISCRKDVSLLEECGFDAALVGEGLVVKEDAKTAVRELRSA